MCKQDYDLWTAHALQCFSTALQSSLFLVVFLETSRTLPGDDVTVKTYSTEYLQASDLEH